MSFLKKLFGSDKQKDKIKSDKTYKEVNNRGTRYENKNEILAYWSARQASKTFDPFVMYIFDNKISARNAMLSLDVIHEAIDSKKLICTEVLEFGSWGWDDGSYEAFICGKELSHDLWKQAKESFIKHGGIRKNDEEPEKPVKKKVAKKKINTRKVKFIRQEQKQSSVSTQILTYRVHRGPDAETAKAFLEKNPVTKGLYYIIVETPEGNFGRDIDGIYRE